MVDRVKSQLDEEGVQVLIQGRVYLGLSARHFEALTNITRRSTLLRLQVPLHTNWHLYCCFIHHVPIIKFCESNNRFFSCALQQVALQLAFT